MVNLQMAIETQALQRAVEERLAISVVRRIVMAQRRFVHDAFGFAHLAQGVIAKLLRGPLSPFSAVVQMFKRVRHQSSALSAARDAPSNRESTARRDLH